MGYVQEMSGEWVSEWMDSSIIESYVWFSGEQTEPLL